MGMMVEFLTDHFEKELTNDQIGQILHSTICNIDPEMIELSIIAIKALNRAMPQTGPNFANKEQRDFIMQGLFRAIGI